MHLSQYRQTLYCTASDPQAHPSLILWIKNRLQHAVFDGFKSSILVVNTGQPQGCELS